MNLRVFENFLRHLLFLFIILKAIGGVILIHMLSRSHGFFDTYDILPLVMEAPRTSLTSALYQMDMTLFCTTCAALFICMMGFVGAIYLHSYPLINFTVGLDCVFVMIGEFGSVLNIAAIVRSWDRMVIDYVHDIFERNNEYLNATEQADAAQTWREPYNSDGWVAEIEGTKQEHNLIDYIHTTFKCCGLWGRTYWDVRQPASCCDETEYPGDSCHLGQAYTTSCLFYYYAFEAYLNQTMVMCVCLGLCSLALAVCSLYLSRLHALYPTQDFGSETSTDTEDDN